ncbi:MAG: paraquat-inducible protein A [Pseudomonadota bacterium]
MISLLRPVLLLVSGVSFGLGISLPLMKFEKLWFFSEMPSLLRIIFDLWDQQEILLSIIVAAFSLVFPLLKLYSTHQAVYHGKAASGWAATLAKWSMMDVLLVALVIFAAKTSGLANAISQPGLWFYALSTLTAAAAAGGLGKRN